MMDIASVCAAERRARGRTLAGEGRGGSAERHMAD